MSIRSRLRANSAVDIARLNDFERRLLRRLPRNSTARPFTCDGNPVECKWFVVGFNPATSMATPFWEHWKSGHGFLESKWLEDYRAYRRSAGKRTAMSATRSRMEPLLEVVGKGCLVTNLHNIPSPDARRLSSSDRDTSLFEFLLDCIQPEVIVPHGRKAREYFERRGWPGLVVPAPSHFCRMSFLASHQFGEEVVERWEASKAGAAGRTGQRANREARHE